MGRRVGQCLTCRQFKTLLAHGLCSGCYHKRPEVMARIAANTAKHRQKIREYVRACKDVPCADCLQRYPSYVMDFDHLGEKEFNVAKMVDKSLEKVKAEIAKCEVVCSNCHRIRTHERRANARID